MSDSQHVAATEWGTNKRYVHTIRRRAKDRYALARPGSVGPTGLTPGPGAQQAERGDELRGANASGVAVVGGADRDGDPARRVDRPA
jgi:hypothetical protein